MTLWPTDDRRPTLMVLGLLAFSGSVSYAYTFMLAPVAFVEPSPLIPVDVWRWATTALLAVIVWILKKGYSTVVGKFTELTEKMDEMSQRQQAFVVAVVQITVETHPEKAEEIMGRFAPLLQK